MSDLDVYQLGKALDKLGAFTAKEILDGFPYSFDYASVRDYCSVREACDIGDVAANVSDFLWQLTILRK